MIDASNFSKGMLLKLSEDLGRAISSSVHGSSTINHAGSLTSVLLLTADDLITTEWTWTSLWIWTSQHKNPHLDQSLVKVFISSFYVLFSFISIFYVVFSHKCLYVSLTHKPYKYVMIPLNKITSIFLCFFWVFSHCSLLRTFILLLVRSSPSEPLRCVGPVRHIRQPSNLW